MGDCYIPSCILFPTFLPMQAIPPPLAKLPEVMFSLIQKVCNYHGKTHTHTHTSQMPISAQQWRMAVGQGNASRSLRPHVTGKPKMKLTSWDVLVFILTALLGAILLSGDGGRGTRGRSE